MRADAIDYFHRGDPLVIVFNCPAGFWHLSQILAINSKKFEAKSQVIFVISKPEAILDEIDCGAIVTPPLAAVHNITNWAETYLQKSRQEVLSNILQIQELQLRNYEYEIKTLKYKYTYNSEAMKPFARKIYFLEDKINKIKQAATILHSVLSVPIQ